MAQGLSLVENPVGEGSGGAAGHGESTVHENQGACMKLRVDSDRCQGHNRCAAVAPGLVEIDDLGYAHAIGDGTVPADQERAAQLAVSNCPELAISIDED